MDSVFRTILAGVSVFIIGQFIVKLVLEPLVRFKEAQGEVSAVFLRSQASITNATGGSEVAEQIKRAASQLLVQRQAVPFYSALSAVSRLPNENDLIEGCKSLNFIASCQLKVDTSNLEEQMSEVERTLGVVVRYS